MVRHTTSTMCMSMVSAQSNRLAARQRAALFDLDGTLFDSLGIWERIDREFLSDRGITLPDDYAQTVEHMSLNTAAQYTIKRFGLDEQAHDLVQEWQERALNAYATVQYKPFAQHYVQYLRSQSVAIALVTSLSRPLFEQANHATQVSQYADAVCLIEDIGSAGKHEPDIFQHASHVLQCKPQHCVVFEDTVAGIRSASQLGMRTCAVLDRRTKPVWQTLQSIANYTITDFSQAPTLDSLTKAGL